MRVFIGLGSNLDDPQQQLETAIRTLKKLSVVSFVAVSPFYRSAPMPSIEEEAPTSVVNEQVLIQADYLNAVVAIDTHLSALELLDLLQNIENDQGRVRKQRWGARTLDLDILLYGDKIIKHERLVIPHYGIAERSFVLYPLRDIVGDAFQLPQLGSLKALLQANTKEKLNLKRLI